ncbi:L,D-transpeptidase [Catellatospora vulcania]|uniref:L,D-transpeptidase n=1 Tax=Catellatospora vulcania TaxID=1460450 RepID=UPI0012D4866A|nr:Ig-like domain-containing protein [Catellatospora vulcania]
MSLRTTARRGAMALVLAVVAPLALTACSKGETPPSFVAPTQSAPVPAPASTEPLALAVTPAEAAKNQPVSAEIGTKVSGGQVQSVTMTDAAGGKVGGSMRADGSSWVPSKPLKYGKKYSATVVAVGPDGTTMEKKTSFTTMGRPSKKTGAGLYLFAERTYGVAMPVVIEFTKPVPASARAAVERRLFVKVEPPQPGIWHWSSALQVMYRGPEYWQTGTKITVRAALEGVPMGDGRYGDADRLGVGNIAKEKIELIVDNANKRMQVFKNDAVVKTIPVSLGKKTTPSSSGTMVIMDKQRKTVFDTTDDPGNVDRYVVNIEYAQRLTWGGEYIHAAPWSVQHQGVRNVSHGCVNVSMANAVYLFNLTSVGTPVTVKGTERKVKPANGWTAWSVGWEDYMKGSALPIPPELAALGNPDPSASAQPSPSVSPTA